jgi:hypothetical protein
VLIVSFPSNRGEMWLTRLRWNGGLLFLFLFPWATSLQPNPCVQKRGSASRPHQG